MSVTFFVSAAPVLWYGFIEPVSRPVHYNRQRLAETSLGELVGPKAELRFHGRPVAVIFSNNACGSCKGMFPLLRARLESRGINIIRRSHPFDESPQAMAAIKASALGDGVAEEDVDAHLREDIRLAKKLDIRALPFAIWSENARHRAISMVELRVLMNRFPVLVPEKENK